MFKSSWEVDIKQPLQATEHRNDKTQLQYTKLVGNVNLQCESTRGMAVATGTDQMISTSV